VAHVELLLAVVLFDFILIVKGHASTLSVSSDTQVSKGFKVTLVTKLDGHSLDLVNSEFTTSFGVESRMVSLVSLVQHVLLSVLKVAVVDVVRKEFELRLLLDNLQSTFSDGDTLGDF